MEKLDRIRTGEIMEGLIDTAGWRHIDKLLTSLIKENKDRIMDMLNLSKNETDIVQIKALVATVKAYEYIQSIPHESIALKNRELKGENK